MISEKHHSVTNLCAYRIAPIKIKKSSARAELFYQQITTALFSAIELHRHGHLNRLL